MALHYIFLILCGIASVTSLTSKQLDSDKATLEKYIQSAKSGINPRYKLHYHVTPPVGWMNDPNGFSYYKGEYHLFYQFYPYKSAWGPMHWGHVTSPDLVDWYEQPTALIPGVEMCFSGDAVVDGDNLVLVYTGHRVTDTEPFTNETQYLAYSNDGVNFEKYVGNPVLSYTPYNVPDFRDPKVWKHGEYWYAIIGSRTEDKRGRVLLFRSVDLKSWDYLSIIGESKGDTGHVWECPDFFEINGKYVLLISPQGMKPKGDRYKNVHQVGYIIGSFNYDTFEFIPEVEFQEVDFGHDFYASQTVEKDGRRYLTAWFSSWDIPYPEAADGWVGALTIIRELKLVGNRILMKPVEGIIKLREYSVIHGNFKPGQEVNFEKTGEIIIQGNLSQKIELLVEGNDGGGKAWIRWDPEVERVIVDRGSDDIRQVEWSPIGSHSWRLFLDASSIELFCGEGEVVFSSRVYPDGNWKLTNLSSQTLTIEAYHLRRSVT